MFETVIYTTVPDGFEAVILIQTDNFIRTVLVPFQERRIIGLVVQDMDVPVSSFLKAGNQLLEIGYPVVIVDDDGYRMVFGLFPMSHTPEKIL